MPKKKTTTGTRSKAVRAPVTKPVEPSPVVKDTPKMSEPKGGQYTVLSWHNRKLFQCTACPFNTLNERTFWEHWVQRHQPPKPRPVGTGLVGPDGKPLGDKEG